MDNLRNMWLNEANGPTLLKTVRKEITWEVSREFLQERWGGFDKCLWKSINHKEV